MSIARLHLTRDTSKRTERKIELIKEIRSLTNLGLKEAKDLADELDDKGSTAFSVSASDDLSNLRSLCQKENITIQNSNNSSPEIELPTPATDHKIHLTLPYKQPLIRKIDLIKEIRILTDTSLTQAKTLVEELISKHKVSFDIAENANPNTIIALCKAENIGIKLPNLPKNPHPLTVATDTVPKAKPAIQSTHNQINMLNFSGDILQEIDLKTFLVSQFRLNYSQAAETIDKLQNNQSTQFDINPAEKDFIAAALDRYAVSYQFI